MSLQEAVEFLREKTGYLDWGDERLAGRLDCSVEIAGKAKQIVKQENNPNKDNAGTYDEYDQKENHENENQNRGYDVPTAQQDQSLEEYCESIGIDPERIDKYNDVKYWTDASGNRRYSIVPKKLNDQDFDPENAFREAISEYSPQDYSNIFNRPEKHKSRLAVLNLYDAHLDKVCYLSETDESSSIENNIETFETAFDELLQSVEGKNPEKIVIPVGNDFWHTNDASLSTKKGTDMSDRVHISDKEAFKLGVNLLRRCIDKARSIAPVQIIPVKGNHDEDRVFYLTECLLVAYENQEDVDVMDNRRQRNYYRYGEWLFGFAHGDKERKAKQLPMRMATDGDSKPHWSEITHGVFFLGDIHHQKKYKFMESIDFQGCEVKFLRSMGTTDEWHWSKGFTGIPKTAYAFVYDKDGKRDQEFKVNI